MIIEKGEKVHVVYRRLLENEVRRHFMGEIVESNGSIARIDGFVSIFDSTTNKFTKKSEKRTTIIDLAESGYIANILPNYVIIDDLQYVLNQNKKLVLTDGKTFSLDINEFGNFR
ncbi:MAG: hypothetical protein KJ950_10545 [Proteobacteria bacterium]|nr:hypothetical protein [Pseudomonadota bacterium]MBU1687498.1 hypothetical protein [Pseudomonadota bacterium]